MTSHPRLPGRIAASVEAGDGTWTLTDEGREAKTRIGATVDGIRARVAGAAGEEQFATTMASLEAIARAFGWSEEDARGIGGRFGFGPRGFGRGFGREGFGRGFGRQGFGPGHHQHGHAEHGHPHHHGGGHPEHGHPHHHGAGGFGGEHRCGHQHGHGHHDRGHRHAQRAFERGFDAGFARGRDA